MAETVSRIRPLAIVAATAAFGAALLVACTRDAPPVVAGINLACPAPQAIPAGFDYPQSAQTVQTWVARRDAAASRAHGWNLWAALNSVAGDTPIWKSWCTETQAFARTVPIPLPTAASATTVAAVTQADHGDRPMRAFKLQNGLTSGADPINFPVAPVYAIPPAVMTRYRGSGCILPPSATSTIPTLANGPTLQNNGDVMVAGVIYNDAAYSWIRDKKLYETRTLAGLRPPPGATRQMAPMPERSIVLKPMMWPVMGKGFTALPMWDDLKSDGGVYSGFEIRSQWPRAVAITAGQVPKVPGIAVSFLHGVTMAKVQGGPQYPIGPNAYLKAAPVGIDQFYHYRPNLHAMAACDRAILDASAWYAYGRMFEQGDYLALVAMHIMTKEQPAWTFQSLWWHDRPNVGPYAADRPNIPQARGPWAHYLMTSTYGWPERPGGDSWPVAYNPYIELAADHPIRTNCVNCHHRAAWPGQQDSYQATGGPDALQMFDQNNPVIFGGKIGVDSLWSISDRVPGPRPSPTPSPAAVASRR